MENHQPALVGREEMLTRIRPVFQTLHGGRGAMLLLAGSAGIGKTRLAEEITAEAEKRGFRAGVGTSLAEGAGLYHPWAEALRALQLDHLVHGEPPPRLMALYLLSSAGLPAAKAERAGFTEDADLLATMLNNAADFLRDALPAGANQRSDDLLRFAVGGRGILVVRASCFGVLAVFNGRESELFIEELRSLVRIIDREATDLLRAWDGNRAEVQGLSGHLESVLDSGKFEGVEVAVDGESRKLNVFENVTYGLRRAAASSPLLVALDDLQWADPLSLGLLHYVARNTRNDPVLLMGAYRTEDAPPHTNFRQFIVGLGREDLATEIGIEPLTSAGTRELAQRLLGANDLPDEFFDLLARESGGNPLCIREVLAGLKEEGVIAGVGDGGPLRITKPMDRLQVPGKVRDAISLRLSRLDREDREVLEAAAVCGTRFHAALVAETSGLALVRVLRSLNATARTLGVVRGEGEAWRFDHPLLRQVLYGEISAELARLYHVQAAEALIRRGSLAMEVGEHLAAGHDSRATEKLEASAREALDRGAPEETERLLRLALETAAPDRRWEIQLSRATALRFLGRISEARVAVREAQLVGAPPGRCAVMDALLIYHQGAYQELVEFVDASLPAVQGVERGRLLHARAEALYLLGNYDEAAKQANAALALLPAESAGQESGSRADALRLLGRIEKQRGHFERALELLREVLKMWEESKNQRRAAAARLSISGVLDAMGDIDGAIAAARESDRIFEATGSRLFALNSKNNLAGLLATKGDLPRAISIYRDCVSSYEKLGDKLGSAGSICGLGGALWLSGNSKEGLVQIDSALQLMRSKGELEQVAQALITRVPPLVANSRLEEAESAAQEAQGIGTSRGLPIVTGRALRALGEVQAAQGNVAAARTSFGSALRTFEALGARLDIAETHAALARLERGAGVSAAARAHVAKAAELFDGCNLPIRANEIRSIL